MILERVEKDGLVKGVYDSSNVIASSYDKSSKELKVIFKGGNTYIYEGVTDSDFMRFETAESQGKVLNSNIKSYNFTKGDKVDADAIVNRIKKLKIEELVKFETGMGEFMVKCNDDFLTNGSFDLKMINQLEHMITSYKTMRK
tara:strand:- start:12609 stop:13037 length:429 start_codon:yes stop_codon:yes gene_type:complete